MVPDLLRVIQVGTDAMLNGVLESQDTTLGLSLITDIGVLVAHAHHHSLVGRATHDGGKDGAGSVSVMVLIIKGPDAAAVAA